MKVHNDNTFNAAEKAYYASKELYDALKQLANSEGKYAKYYKYSTDKIKPIVMEMPAIIQDAKGKNLESEEKERKSKNKKDDDFYEVDDSEIDKDDDEEVEDIDSDGKDEDEDEEVDDEDEDEEVDDEDEDEEVDDEDEDSDEEDEEDDEDDDDDGVKESAFYKMSKKQKMIYEAYIGLSRI